MVCRAERSRAPTFVNLSTSYTKFRSRSHDAVIRVYGDAMRLTPTPNGKNGPGATMANCLLEKRYAWRISFRSLTRPNHAAASIGQMTALSQRPLRARASRCMGGRKKGLFLHGPGSQAYPPSPRCETSSVAPLALSRTSSCACARRNGAGRSVSAIAAITHCYDCRKGRKSGKRFCSNQISRCKALLNGRQCLSLCHFEPCNSPLQFSKPSRKLVTPSRRPSSSRLFQRCWPDAMSSGSRKPEREKRLHSFGRSLPN
jgi:hypothetical protein